MAAPTVASVTSTSFNADTTSHACNLPATVDADDLLLIVFGMANIDFAANLMTPPSGFTEKFDDQWDLSGERHGIGVFAKIADGTEDGGTADVVTATATAGCAQVYRIQGAGSTVAAVEVSAKAQVEDGTNADPPNHTPSGGSLDYLWIAVASIAGGVTASAAPTNYTNLTTNSGSASEDVGLSTARRALTASSENPGTFTSTVEHWLTVTASVAPAAGGTLHEATAASSVAVTGAATGKKTGKATATSSVTVTGAATAHAIHKATATSTVTITGSATAHAVRKATASATISVTGSATGKSQPQRATATTSITVTGSATGKRTAKATAAASITVTGAATGAINLPPKTATGTSNIRITGTATGHKRKHRTAASTLTVTCAATGKARRKATASLSLSVSTTAKGWVPREHALGVTRLTVTATPYSILEVD